MQGSPSKTLQTLQTLQTRTLRALKDEETCLAKPPAISGDLKSEKEKSY